MGGNLLSRIDPLGLLNILAGSGGNSVIGGTGYDATSGGFVNVETGNSYGFTSTGGGASWATSGQAGLGAMAGVFVGFVTGDASNVAGPFINWNLAIPGTNFGATIYFNENWDWVGGAVSYGPGIGFTRTTTTTTTYPSTNTTSPCAAH